MAFSSRGGSSPKADMNVVPLIDILLVLLIIFMVTAPTPSLRINVNLPQRSPNVEPPRTEPPPPLQLRISSAGEVTVNNTLQPMATLQAYFEDITQVRTQLLPVDQQPRLEINVDLDAEYEVLAQVLARARNAQLEKISFVDETTP
ncbi:biopolymer transporter ExbD [Silanimonas sp.]|uniref:ExbD/TolR family protein n=1 Tax=Silanimonas sp. TaxID=1929290 RepID=UPI001BC2D759|nr:biopolymer transporter ExbD [Silanimonas sp.]MBS3896743.1 biopolymer transporter ExbD [Silanimonas sp.]MBS3924635.1 biopolymer transporter ExbD [Xanthomonadaceae bacterium]MBS3924985.1 biopolymer transporter ExbD [Xanthomonadaceae bacterium]